MRIKDPRIPIFLLFSLLFGSAMAQDSLINEPTDTLAVKKKHTYWQNLINGNRDRTHERKFDVSFVVAPSFTREASIGVGGLLSGLYRVDRKDSTMSPSNVSIGGNISLLLFYNITLSGRHFFGDKRSRLIYDLAFMSKNLKFWGVNYEACDTNQVSKYRRQTIRVKADYTYQLAKDFHAGVALNFMQTKINKLETPEYLDGAPSSYLHTGVGLLLQYDSRDISLLPTRGIYVLLRETFFPKGLGSFGQNLWATNFTFDAFQKVWPGGILAFDLSATINSNNAPWSMREELGGIYRMRGYYTGRYIDNNTIACQLELRQNIYKRVGCVVFIGAGNIFSSFKNFHWSRVMPTYGLGFRFEFKHHINLRIDYGFGKQTSGFVFGIGESF